MSSCPFCDWFFFALSVIIALTPYVLLFVILRPRPVVDCVCDKDDVIRIRVKNAGRWTITMLRIEVSAVLQDNRTLHLSTDLTEFVMLSSQSSRTFKANALHPAAQGYTMESGQPWTFPAVISSYAEGAAKLRIRVHGFNAVSGLGKAIEYQTP